MVPRPEARGSMRARQCAGRGARDGRRAGALQQGWVRGVVRPTSPRQRAARSLLVHDRSGDVGGPGGHAAARRGVEWTALPGYRQHSAARAREELESWEWIKSDGLPESCGHYQSKKDMSRGTGARVVGSAQECTDVLAQGNSARHGQPASSIRGPAPGSVLWPGQQVGAHLGARSRPRSPCRSPAVGGGKIGPPPPRSPHGFGRVWWEKSPCLQGREPFYPESGTDGLRKSGYSGEGR